MMRPVSFSPPLARPLQWMAAKCEVSQVPRTCTRMTMSKSAGVMFQMARSRTMPALLTRTSRRP